MRETWGCTYYRVLIQINTPVGQKLVNLPRNSRVGVLIDVTRSLHLYINGQDQGVAAPDLPKPCFAFFDLYGPYRQVRVNVRQHAKQLRRDRFCQPTNQSANQANRF